jgi:hypothetical protein
MVRTTRTVTITSTMVTTTTQMPSAKNHRWNRRATSQVLMTRRMNAI